MVSIEEALSMERTEIGSGDYGRVYELNGRDDIILKVFNDNSPKADGFTSSDITPTSKEEFKTEVDLMQMFSDSGVTPRYYAHGPPNPSDEEEMYLVMEYIKKQDVSERDDVTFFKSFLSALDTFFEKGYVHSDIKPDNVIVDTQSRCRIIDLGTVSNERYIHWRGRKIYGEENPSWMPQDLTGDLDYAVSNECMKIIDIFNLLITAGLFWWRGEPGKVPSSPGGRLIQTTQAFVIESGFPEMKINEDLPSFITSFNNARVKTGLSELDLSGCSEFEVYIIYEKLADMLQLHMPAIYEKIHDGILSHEVFSPIDIPPELDTFLKYKIIRLSDAGGAAEVDEGVPPAEGPTTPTTEEQLLRSGAVGGGYRSSKRNRSHRRYKPRKRKRSHSKKKRKRTKGRTKRRSRKSKRRSKSRRRRH
jgi:hypothetical protein